MSIENNHWKPLSSSPLTLNPADNSAINRQTAELTKVWHEKFLQSVNLEEFIRMEPSVRRNQIELKLNELMRNGSQSLPFGQTKEIVTYILNEALGYGALAELVADQTITEIMVNGHETVYIERNGQMQRADVQFQNEDHLRNIIDRIVSRVGRRVDEASPTVDARLEDGSRVNIMIPPLALDGPALTIRKFQSKPLQLTDLVEMHGSLSPEMATYLEACVRAKFSILVSGGTGTGKTTLLNALASFIDGNERIVTIEDSAELKFHEQHPHVVRAETRPPNMQDRGAVTIRDLVRNSLRMRPDRIIVGEVRGAETLDMLQAMNTGHEGSMTTIHANGPDEAMRRLETMVMWAEGASSLPIEAIRQQIVSAIDIVVQVTRYPNGRRISAISEVQELRHGEILTADIFRYDVLATDPTTGNVEGCHDATGVQPKNFAILKTSNPDTIHPDLFMPKNFQEQFAEILADSRVTEIMVNGPNDVRIERRGEGMSQASIQFESEQHLRSMVNSMIAPLGKRLDERNPTVDARLPSDGSRINVVIPPLSPDGTILTVRRFPKEPLQIDELIKWGSMTQEMADFLQACVRAKFNILISGGTGSGKTTLLNALSGFIGSESTFLAGDDTDERILTVEDVAELRIQHDHWVRLEARSADEFGEGKVTIRDLVINALRMRPDRIIVGEVRGAEALDMLQAMNTGHEGSMTTVHANSPEDAFYRLETMVTWAGTALPSHTIRAQIVGALDLIVQANRLPDGSRRVTHISEVMKGDRAHLGVNDIYRYIRNAKNSSQNRHELIDGQPSCLQRMVDHGITYDFNA